VSKATLATGYFPPPIRAKPNVPSQRVVEFHPPFMGTCT
jgi:hypothetical protein